MEEKLWEGRPTLLARLFSCCVTFVVLGVLPFFFDSYIGAMGLISFIVLYLPIWLLISLCSIAGKKYEITPAQITVRSGVIKKKSVTIERTQIETVQVIQNAWERLLGYGHLRLAVRGVSGEAVVLENVRHPFKIKNLIDATVSNETASTPNQ